MSAVFDVAPEHLVARARLELLFDPEHNLEERIVKEQFLL